MPSVASQASIKVIKTTPFKGGTKRWSNRYYLNQTTIPDTSHFNTLADNVVAAEKLIFTSWTTIVEVIGYNGGSDVPVFTRTYSTAGTSVASGDQTPLEVAALVRYSTTQRTSKNHPVYLFNYYHGILVSSTSGQHDKIAAGQVSLLNTYAAAWVAGFSDGTTTYKKAGPHGAVAQGYLTMEYATHRDFAYSSSV